MDALPDLANPRDNLVSRLGILALDLNDELRSMMGTLRNPSGVVVVATSSEFLEFRHRPGDGRCYPQREPDSDRLVEFSPRGAEADQAARSGRAAGGAGRGIAVAGV